MQTTELDELLKTVEQIRQEKHPDLDSDFLAAVARAEEQNPEDDAEAMRAIQDALRVVINSRES